METKSNGAIIFSTLAIGKMRLPAIVAAVLLVISSCTSHPTVVGGSIPTLTALPGLQPTETMVASPTAVGVLEPSVQPEQAGQPEANPCETHSPELICNPVITTGSAAEVVELFRWEARTWFGLGPIATARLSADGQTLILAEPGGEGLESIVSWVELPSGRVLQSQSMLVNEQGIFISPDGSRVAAIQGACPSDTESCLLEVRRAEDGKVELSLTLDVIQWVAFSPDNLLAALAIGEQVQVWELGTGILLQSLPDSFLIDQLLYSPSGRLLVGYTRWSENVYVWDIDGTGERIELASDVYLGSFFSSGLTFSPDGSNLAIGFNGVVGLWDTQQWVEGLSWQSHNAPITRVAYSPDGSLVASAAEDGSLALANPQTGEVLIQMKGHLDYVEELVFSEDGKRLYSTGLDGVFIMWGVKE